MVGQPAAAVTVGAEVGVGVGVGAGVGWLMTTLPPVPGEAMSVGPQPASASPLQPTSIRPWNFFTWYPPWMEAGAIPAGSRGDLGAQSDSHFAVS